MLRRIVFVLFVALQSVSTYAANLDSLLLNVERAPSDTAKGRALLELGRWYIEVNPDTTLILVEQGISLLSASSSRELLCDAYRLKGGVLRFRGEYNEAMYWFKKALAVLEGSKDLRRYGSSYNNVGLVYWDLGNYVLAIENLLISLKATEASGNYESMISTLINIGLVYDYQDKVELAKHYYARAASIAKKVNDLSSLSLTYNNLGYMYMRSKDFDSSAMYLHASLRLAIDNRYMPNAGYATNNLGALHAEMKQMDSAYFYIDSSLRIREKLGDQFGIGMCYLNFGKWDLEAKKYSSSEKWLLKTKELADITGSKVLIMDVAQALAALYQASGDYRKAYTNMETYYQLKDSLGNEESRRKTVEMRSEFEIDKKQKELDLVRKDAQIDSIAKESELKRQRLMIGFTLALVALMLFFLVFVYRQFKAKKKANEEITVQKSIIEEKNKEILDSIHYARRIQRALLASDHLLKKHLHEYFVLYQPKDIVSGDFYWASEATVKDAKSAGQKSFTTDETSGHKFIFCVADCTGHGVPGAFMSLLNITKLNEVITERGERIPSVIFDKVREELIASLNPEGVEEESKDGMDAVLIAFDRSSGNLQLACANNPVWIIRSGELIELKPDKMPVGTHHGTLKPFTPHDFKLHSGDMIYLFTDGYADQFGGPKGKKFKYAQFADLLKEISSWPAEQQKLRLQEVIAQWKGNLEQNDDILIVGIRV
ncbi:MAG TPA: hypothetical protein DEP18_00025 [Flavobacteriales bacterium]|nr:hypothetical protein [Flavobacteriales bacterium]HRE75482.1 tetratricopeptide repeat protein [Flavobacteriales bacterium]HRJ35190.1 tetratricopeptide repeat protein [Flavobacteriales bacterium]HRJ37715.1 tetratricopeptide repeat protein [Flavobacteriales bacterium]